MASKRTRHLRDVDGREEVTLSSGHVVTSAPGYVIFVDAWHNGRWQTITVDPTDLAGFVHGLNDMRDRTEVR
jgi:hypothetical protein